MAKHTASTPLAPRSLSPTAAPPRRPQATGPDGALRSGALLGHAARGTANRQHWSPNIAQLGDGA